MAFSEKAILSILCVYVAVFWGWNKTLHRFLFLH